MKLPRGALCAALVVSACYRGADGEDAGADGGGDDGEIPGGQLCSDEDPSAAPLKRLSVTQYRNTIEDLLGDGPSGDLMAVVEPLFADLPADGGDDDTFRNMDLRLSQRHVNTYYAVADTLAAALVDDIAGLTDLAGSCADAASLDSGCVDAFIDSFGRRAYRRPLSNEEVEAYRSLNDASKSTPEVIRDVVFVILNSPKFIYHFETQGAPIGGREDLLALDPYEIASRLSYHFWQSMPDQELFDAAEDGSLATQDGFEAQVDRILADDDGRLRVSLRDFYGDWYRLDSFSGFAATEAFNAFANGEGVGAAGSDHYADMIAEIEALTDYYTWDVDGTFADMMQSELSFTESPDLARLYGVQPWDGESEPPSFDAGERSGLLTRAAFLVTGDEKTAPLHRGNYLRGEILCEPLAPPDPNTLPEDALDPPPFDPMQTTRERYEAKTAPAECMTCHQLFNPIGFALEAYDALGRHRTAEEIYDDTGQLVATRPLDTNVTVFGLASEEVDIAGPTELMDLVVQTGKLDACFARHYFRYTYRRNESPADSCVIEQIEESMSGSDGSIRAGLRHIAMQPEFRVRLVE